MNCHHCGKHIDLELTIVESHHMQRILDKEGVVILCVDCYLPEETELLSDYNTEEHND